MKFIKTLKLMLNSIAERASCRVFIANNSSHRKVLIVADEPAIKNLLMLVKKLDSRRITTPSKGACISTIHRRSFDTAILDLRCSAGRPVRKDYGFGEVWASITGRVLVLNAEVSDRKTMELAERYIYNRHSIEGILFGLTRLVRTVFGRSPAPHRV